ncbi:unnamed protein product [Symbiodinium natans]|uniref:Uncharacterized protein n=1 Tax=Symbiodinium natans TaxID=878477 RepID=A0A812NTI9_9DINO|nr:unnamed protein product [Symbiodinium natans]
MLAPQAHLALPALPPPPRPTRLGGPARSLRPSSGTRGASRRGLEVLKAASAGRRGAMKGTDGKDGGALKNLHGRTELALDVFFFVSVQVLFRKLGCTNANTCALPWVVTAARGFFVLFNLCFMGTYTRLLSRARQRPSTPEIAQDITIMEGKRRKAAMKITVLLLLHVSLGLVAPLVTSCLITTVAFPFWWDRKASMLLKYW